MTTVTEDEVTPDLADLDVAIADTAPDPSSDFNAEPPCLPELFDENGKAVPYVIDLMLGRDKIKKELFDEKNEGVKTGKKLPYFTADILGKAVNTADGREFDFAYYNSFVRPSQRYTTFVRKGKGMSEIIHLAQVIGFDVAAYEGMTELAKDMIIELSKRGEQQLQCLAWIQWQWYSKEATYQTRSGEQKKGKVVRYGMKNADSQLSDGTFERKIIHKETGEELTARAVITRIAPLP